VARHLRSGAAALSLVTALAACGSSGPSAPGTTGTTEPASGQGAVAAVTAAYSTLFDLANPAVDPKVAVVQDGGSLRSTLSAELHSSLAKLAKGATVTAVQVQSASDCAGQGLPSVCATVDYNILSAAGKPLFPAASKGYAVYSGGKWLVAKETICGLLSLAGSGAPAGC
jgi:hypothetical protein